MTPWSAWIPDVAIDVPGCPSFTIELAVKRTVTDFLERTHWLQRTSAALDITGGAGSRAFPTALADSAAGERVLAVLKAWISDKPIDVYGPEDVDDEWPDWQTRTGTPECVVLQREDGYYVVPAPTSTMTGALRLKAAIGLLDTATGCDDLIATSWREGIAAGAKFRLMMQSGKPWANPERAVAYGSGYNEAVGAASLRALRTPARRKLTTRPYFF